MEIDFASEWFQFAEADLSSAEYLQGMRPQPLEIICYHCQQSAEKRLKGYLILKGILQPPRTHDLDVLCEMCLEHDERFQEIGRA